MTTYREIKAGRRLIWAGILTGLAIALSMGIASYISDEGTALRASALIVMMALPSTIALLALDRRPSLLTAAAMAALVQSVLLLTSGLGLLQVIPGILWYLAGQKRPRPAAAPPWATWARPLLAVATLLPLFVMFSHLDPICTVTDADGTVISSEADPLAPTGWALTLGSSSGTSTDAEGVTRSCISDTVRPWESVLSLVVSGVVLGLASRWPTSNQLFGTTRETILSG